MAKKNRPSIPGINDVRPFLKPENALPVYFLFGEDIFALDALATVIEKKFSKILESDFDKEVISADKGTSINDVLDIAQAFPFGSGKKLVVLKNFENTKDKQHLAGYVKNPPEFTILVIINSGAISNLNGEPYSTLIESNSIFEARKLTGNELADWLVKTASRQGYTLSLDNAHALMEISGEDKIFLEDQLQKLINYIGEEKEITFEAIKKVASQGKHYTIFDLTDAITAANKGEALKVAYGLLKDGEEILSILGFITKFIQTITHATELIKEPMSPYEAAKKLNVRKKYYDNCVNARYFMNKPNLRRAGKALLNAELAVKTSATDNETIITSLISEMFSKN